MRGVGRERLIQRFLKELFRFGLKQAKACLFGGYMLFIMIVTSVWYPLEDLHRYDFMFLSAVGFQLFLLLARLETLRECGVIVMFHVVATVMELFKTSDSIGAWAYPEEFVFGIGNVPLFTGFMYSAVGSYIARVWRIFDFEYSHYPRKVYTVILVSLIYGNFLSHHFIWDFRWVIIGVTVTLFFRTKIFFKISTKHRNMPLLIGWLLVAFFIWIAENIGTYTNSWIYPNQTEGWRVVSPAKLTAWYLLMLLSFVLVSLVNEIKIRRAK